MPRTPLILGIFEALAELVWSVMMSLVRFFIIFALFIVLLVFLFFFFRFFTWVRNFA